MDRAVIVSTGKYLPDFVLKNEDMVQFSEEARRLIGEKTGVYERRFAAEDQCTSDLAVKAAEDCLGKAGFPAAQIEGIILATSSPDRIQPATATRVQDLIGAAKAFAFDINSVCSGGAFGIAVADSLIRSGTCRNVLLIAAEVYSRILNKKDFGTYPYFGDGAAAVLFQAGPDTGRGVISSRLATNGAGRDKICVPGGGTLMPFEKMPGPRSAYFRMKGPDVFDFAVEKGPEIILELVRGAGVSLADVKCFICHQANINIINKIADTLGLPRQAFYVNLNRYGNTAGASVLIALDEALSEKAVAEGDLVVTAAFGGGLSWGANLLRL
jgi:3-oxoacyl-[acyl-carrier-protein] synthase-3